jgi:hypothetical protein
LASSTTMAVINLVMEAMGTTRAAFFTNSSLDVSTSSTSAILDLTFSPECKLETDLV